MKIAGKTIRIRQNTKLNKYNFKRFFILKFLSNEGDKESAEDEFEIDDDVDENDSSFIILYQLLFEKSVNIYLNQNEFYTLYEVKFKNLPYFLENNNQSRKFEFLCIVGGILNLRKYSI